MGKLGEVLLVQLNLFDAEQARAIAREDLRVGSLSEVPAAIDPAVRRLAGPLLPEDARAAEGEPVIASEGAGGGALSTAFLVSGGAVTALGVAALLVGSAGALWAATVVSNVEERAANRNGAKATGAAMVITAGAGAAVGVVGAALLGASFVEWE